VLLKGVKQDDQVARALIEHSVARACETDPQLPQLALDLGADGELGRRRSGIPPVEVLFDGVVDLRRGNWLRLQQPFQEGIDRFAPIGVSIEDRLGATSRVCVS